MQEMSKKGSTISLRGSGFEFLVTLLSPATGNGTMELLSTTSQSCSICTAFTLWPEDFAALAKYLGDHLSNISQDSHTFLRYDMSFQLQALQGEYDNPGSEHDGTFSLRVMLNIGNAQDGTRLYAGLEGGVTVQACRGFIHDLGRLAKAPTSIVGHEPAVAKPGREDRK